jgi:hypothetical protein
VPCPIACRPCPAHCARLGSTASPTVRCWRAPSWGARSSWTCRQQWTLSTRAKTSTAATAARQVARCVCVPLPRCVRCVPRRHPLFRGTAACAQRANAVSPAAAAAATAAGNESHAGQVFTCIGALSLAGRLDTVDQDLVAWWWVLRVDQSLRECAALPARVRACAECLTAPLHGAPATRTRVCARLQAV